MTATYEEIEANPLAEVEAPPAWVSIWPRGGAKSTHAELAVVALAARSWSMRPEVRTDGHEWLEQSFEHWLYTLFPEYMGARDGHDVIDLAEHHREFWTWVWDAELPRHYCLYVSDTQEQADDHVGNVAAMLVSARFSRWYPAVADRLVGKYGASRGWRRDRIRTRSGFTIDAAGLDSATRGLKLEEDRPDLHVYDDIDRENDSATVTERKRRNLTRAVIPAADNRRCLRLAVQNLILRGGIFDQLQDGTADFLRHRIVSGPHPALLDFDADRDLEMLASGRYQLTGGIPTWEGQGRPQCEMLINDMGLEAFRIECQHDLQAVSDLIFPQFSPALHEYRIDRLPPFIGYIGGIDFGGEGETAHRSAGVYCGVTARGTVIVLREFYDRGINVEQRQMQWMAECEAEFGKAYWRADGSQQHIIAHWRSSNGFLIRRGMRDPGRVEARIRQVGFLLTPLPIAPDAAGGRTRLYYLTRCSNLRNEFQHYRRRPAREDGTGDRGPLEVDDDLMDALGYAVEELNVLRLDQTTAFVTIEY